MLQWRGIRALYGTELVSFMESPIEKRGGTYAQINIMEYRFPERRAYFGNAQGADVQRRSEYFEK